MTAKSKPLSPTQKRYLRSLAHPLKAVILVGGKGVSDGLIGELELALGHHELLKVKLAASDRVVRDAWIDEIAARTGAALVQRIGNTAVLFRRNPEKARIVLPR